jgi:hypothetical protein
LINDVRQAAIKSFPLNMALQCPFGHTTRGPMKTISAIATDQSFKAMSVLSFVGLAVSIALMALGMDLNTGWL